MRKLMLIALFIIAVALPVAAQDATPEPTPVVAPDAPPVDFGALGQFGLYLMLAIAGGGSFALVLTRLDTRGKDQLEKAYLSLSPEWQTTIVKIVEVAEALGKLGREVTDGQPNDVPQTPPVTIQSQGGAFSASSNVTPPA